MNQYFYLKIKKRKKFKIKFNISIFNKIIITKKYLKIFKNNNKNKIKYRPFIFFFKKKLKFKLSLILLKFSLNDRKFNLWEKIDYWFHVYLFYDKKKWEDYTVFINFIESKKCFNILYYIFYTKKKLLERDDNKLSFIKEKKNVKFWIWIFNINTNFTVYFHNAKSFLYRFMIYKKYRYTFLKKNFIRYNLSLLSLKILSYVLEEDYKEKVLNSCKSKLNSEIKRLSDVQNCVRNNLKKNSYISYFSFFFRVKWKLMYFSYVIINDLRTTKILYFWLFRYFLFYIIETFFKKFKVRLNVFYFNIDNFKYFVKLFKFKKSSLKKKKKKLAVDFNFNLKIFIKNILNLTALIIREIFNFFALFVDKYLYNDFKNVLKKSKIYIYPELKALIDYIKNFFKK